MEYVTTMPMSDEHLVAVDNVAFVEMSDPTLKVNAYTKNLFYNIY